MAVESYCRHCHAKIRWARTITGASVALDFSSDDEGWWSLSGGIAVAHDKDSAALRRSQGGLLFKPHSATCTRGKTRTSMPESVRDGIRQRREAKRAAKLAELASQWGGVNGS